MKKYLLYMLALLLLAPLPLKAQEQGTFKKDRYIYLWDVTHSMQGKGFKNPKTGKYDLYVKEADIYDQVVEEIVRDINSIPDQTTEIVVIPFQSASQGSYPSAQKPWVYKTASGANKEELIGRIRGSKKEWLRYAHGNTDVVPALRYVMESVISEDRIDYLKILTDGKMADMDGLRQLMAQWCVLARRNKGMHAFYISLNKEASESIHAIIQSAGQQDCFQILDPGPSHGALDFYQVIPYPAIGVNCNDVLSSASPSVTVRLQVKGPDKLPESFKVRFQEQDNPFFTTRDCILSAKDNAFTLPLHFKMDLDGIKQQLEGGAKYPVPVKLTAVDGANVYLLDNTVTLELTVEKEKKLTLSWDGDAERWGTIKSFPDWWLKKYQPTPLTRTLQVQFNEDARADFRQDVELALYQVNELGEEIPVEPGQVQLLVNGTPSPDNHLQLGREDHSIQIGLLPAKEYLKEQGSGMFNFKFKVARSGGLDYINEFEVSGPGSATPLLRDNSAMDVQHKRGVNRPRVVTDTVLLLLLAALVAAIALIQIFTPKFTEHQLKRVFVTVDGNRKGMMGMTRSAKGAKEIVVTGNKGRRQGLLSQLFQCRSCFLFVRGLPAEITLTPGAKFQTRARCSHQYFDIDTGGDSEELKIVSGKTQDGVPVQIEFYAKRK